MLIKLLIILLIITEQIGFSSGVIKLTKIINQVEANKPSTVFLLSNRENLNKPLTISQNKKIPLLPLSPLPVKKKDTATLDTACVSSCVIDAETATLLYDKNKDMRLPMASLAKIMTAYIIFKDNKLDDLVTIKEASTKINAEESQMGLVPGDKLKIRDLLYGLLVYSANDSAKALAEYKAGSEEKFLKLMNDEAKELGLKNTNFASVSGIDAPNQYSSAYDLALLFKCALANDLFLQIINTKDYEFTSVGGVHYILTNTDELLGNDVRILGGKTGSTDQAGRCFVSLASQNGNKVISVVMNCPDRFEETKRLLDWIYSSYIW